MKKKLTNNIGLKIMSVVVGILVWMIVVNIDDPIVTQSYLIPSVQIINEDYLDGEGLVVMADEDNASVRVYITGPRKTVAQITVNDIVAVADLQQAVSLNTDPVMIPITVTCPGISATNISVTPQNLSVTLEEKLTKEFTIGVSSGDSEPGQGYELGSLTVNPETVRITGSASVVNKIDNVSVTVDIDGITEDTTFKEASMVIRDKNGDQLSDTTMSYLKLENDGLATVYAKLWKVRSSVKLEVVYEGEPAEGYVVDSVATVPETVSVAGTTEALTQLEENGNTLTIGAGEIDISGAQEDVELKASLADSLLDEMKLTTGTSEDAWVSVGIVPEDSAIYALATSGIQVTDKPEDYQIAFELTEIELRIQSETGDFSDFDMADVQASITLDEWEEGSCEVAVDITLPDGYELLEEVTTEVRVSEVTVVDSEENDNSE
ncbi:MAG: hypothetical protein LUG62_06315 [Clostridiales bacterium]|nr:hypothetical protein [Clostridiales bacterium]